MKKTEFRELKQKKAQKAFDNGDRQFGSNLKSTSLQELKDRQHVDAMKGRYEGRDEVLEELHRKAQSVFLPPEDTSQREIAHDLSEWMVEHAGYRAVKSEGIKVWKFEPESKTWNSNAEEISRQDMREAVGNLYSTYLKRETIDQIKAINPVPREDTGPSENEIPVKNGVILL